MPLTDDQKALLRLLAQREHGYEDIGALMGLSVDQVRARVREALTELDQAEEEPRKPAPQAAEPAPAPPPPRAHEAESQAASPARAQGSGSPPPAPAPRPGRSPSPRVRLPGDRRRLYELIGGLVVVVLIVLFATGVVNIGGGSKSDGKRGASSTTTASSKQLTQAVLQPVDGGSAKGQAVFGRVGKEAVLQVVAQGLEPSPPGKSYTVWLYRSPKLVLRVGAVKVAKGGRLGARFPLPAELLAYVAAGAFSQIDVSLTADASYRREVAQAKRQKRLPPYTGTDVLRGDITGPIVKKK